MAQSNTTEAGGTAASNASGPYTTGFPYTGPQPEGSSNKKIDAETFATRIPNDLDETDPDSDMVTTGYRHSGPNAPAKPGSPAGDPGPITGLGYNPNEVMPQPALTRHGAKRQHGYSQNPNKG